MITINEVGRRVAASSAILLGLAASSAHAQQPTSDARWQAWLGCWQSSAAAPIGSATAAVRPTAKTPVLCVVPTEGRSAVELLTVNDGQVTERDVIDATGERRTVSRDGCTGWDRTDWSASARRVYLRIELTCPGNIVRRTNGILAFSADGELLDIRGIMAGAQQGVRVGHYRPLVDSIALPASLVDKARPAGLAVSTSRLAASATISLGDIVDASAHVDTTVVMAWLVESRGAVKMDAKRLATLADHGVPGAVTDLLVALANPEKFAITGSSRGGEMREPGDDLADIGPSSGRTIPVYMDSMGYGYDYSRYGYSPFGYGYGYSPYSYGWYNGNRPIVIVVRDPSTTTNTNGRAIKGHGYTRDRGDDGGSIAMPRGSRDGGGSSSGGGSTRTTDSGSGGRTAKPKP